MLKMSLSARRPLRQLPWKLRLLLKAVSFFVDTVLRPNITVNRRLVDLFDRKALSSPNSKDGISSFDVTVDLSRNLWFRIYTPTIFVDAVRIPVIIYYHGGGFVFSNADSTHVDTSVRRYALEFGAIVVSVNYRLAPEYRFPCQYEDGFDALKFIDGMDADLFPAKVDLSRCFIAGDSAGGNLAHHVAVKAAEYNFKKVKVVGLIAIQPFFGGEYRTDSETQHSDGPLLTLRHTDWYWKAFLPVGSDRDHPASNVFGPKSVDISGVEFPPTLLFIGGLDPLQDRDRMYYEGLKRSGKEVHLVEYPNAIHAFSQITELPEFSLFVRKVKDFMQKEIAKL